MGFANPQPLQPYILFITSQAPSGEKLEPWVHSFAEVVKYSQDDSGKITNFIAAQSHFQDAPYSYFDSILHLPTNEPELRRVQVSDTILRILGLWTLMGSYFERATATNIQELIVTDPRAQTLPGLVKSTGFLPHPNESNASCEQRVGNSIVDYNSSKHSSLTAMEALCISPKHLNAVRLFTFARVRIHWTTNVSRHMLLSQYGGRYYLELLALPCALEGRSEEALSKIGQSSLLAYEIRASYPALFNPHETALDHHKWLRWLGAGWWCWCLPCLSRRYLRGEIRALKQGPELSQRLGESLRPAYDPAIEKYAQQRAPLWTQTQFRNLWPRITALEAHLQKARPWGF
ncbi:hypothetical protein BDV96DRAFT_585790 [Lophiotrema nucula]|uniref:Uncharacterized protein n=1 Tax=Lophiotrema nucula TaxID=690887 RepID=A0A6A5YQN7_9PLEO|nr:hypothetical protein BDV96DRAFT_585790 [Lophiotrema nucula]